MAGYDLIALVPDATVKKMKKTGCFNPLILLSGLTELPELRCAQ